MLLAAGMVGLVATQSLAAPSKADQDFAQKATGGGLAEVAQALLAQRNATSPRLRLLAGANKSVAQHAKAGEFNFHHVPVHQIG